MLLLCSVAVSVVGPAGSVLFLMMMSSSCLRPSMAWREGQYRVRDFCFSEFPQIAYFYVEIKRSTYFNVW